MPHGVLVVGLTTAPDASRLGTAAARRSAGANSGAHCCHPVHNL
jgi:hypothetical protein